MNTQTTPLLTDTAEKVNHLTNNFWCGILKQRGSEVMARTFLFVALK